MNFFYSSNQAASRLVAHYPGLLRWKLGAAATQYQAAYSLGLLLLLLLIGFSVPANAAALPADNCSMRTYTQDNYGKTSRGNSPYNYVQANFSQAFPAGLTVGCAGGYTLTLTSANAITDFLPGNGGTAQALAANYTNPTKPRGNSSNNGPNSYAGEFAGQVVALALSVGFDLADASFGSAVAPLRDAVVTSGPFAGRTVGFVLAQANLALGGCSSQYSVAQLYAAVKSINETYDGEQTNGLLSCAPVCNVAAPAITTQPTYCQDAAAAPLSASVALASGASLQLYASATGSTPLAAGFRPSTASTGTTTYYASQVVGSCESDRVPVLVTVVTPAGTPTILPSLAINGSNIAAWGDSFTDAGYGRYPQTLSRLSGYTVYNGGVGGETSVQIKDRMVAATEKHTWPTIIWAGRNDSNNPEQVKASIATMVETLTHTNYLVLSILNGAGEGQGTYAYNQITTLNNDLAALYGSHYLDVRSYLVSQYDPSNPQDVADHAADIPPTSLRTDAYHPNLAGSDLIAGYIYANFDKLLSGNVVVRYCQGAQAAALSNAFTPVSAGATLRFYSSATSTTALGSGTSFVPATTTVGPTTYYVAQAIGTCESSRVAIVVDVTNCTAARSTSTALAPALTSPVVSASALTVYPNPTVRQSTVSFSLPVSQPYTLDIYYNNGLLARRVAAGTAVGGKAYSYTVRELGLPTGSYIVRLVTGKTSQTSRLLLTN